MMKALENEKTRADSAERRAFSAMNRNRNEYERGASDVLRSEHLRYYIDQVIEKTAENLGENLKPIALKLMSQTSGVAFRPALSASKPVSFEDRESFVLSGVVPEIRWSIVVS